MKKKIESEPLAREAGAREEKAPRAFVMRGWWRSRRVYKLSGTFSRMNGAAVPNKFLLQAVSIVPWVYAVFWYAATNSDAPRLAYWANWGWLAIIVLEIAGFFAIRALERRRQPPS